MCVAEPICSTTFSHAGSGHVAGDLVDTGHNSTHNSSDHLANDGEQHCATREGKVLPDTDHMPLEPAVLLGGPVAAHLPVDAVVEQAAIIGIAQAKLAGLTGLTDLPELSVSEASKRPCYCQADTTTNNWCDAAACAPLR
jgi:hypothetical protein